MGGSFSRELKLAKRLQDLCDDQGKEKNPTKSAEILHEFGLLYQEKSPDKISLVQSATFFNAAVVRQPTNQVFQKSLKDFCSHVLLAAKAENLHDDLVKISCKVAKKIDEMRKHTNQSLEKVQIVPCGLSFDEQITSETDQVKQIRQLQAEISEKYTEIMNYVTQECVKLLGEPPCRYSVTGMGSLARKEITPYSDFEHVVILEEGVQHKTNYDDILEYFRWFSVIFHIIIINLKETIIRAVAVKWLNDDSIQGGDWFFDSQINPGIKFDGMQLPACKFPLGRPWRTDNKSSTVELIKPVSEMVKYLSLDEDVKNGYHLADVLTKTCFVSGCEEIHKQYQQKVKEILMEQSANLQPLLIESIKYEMNHDWKGFNPYNVGSGLFKASNCNIKSSLYRSVTLLVSALGRIHSIHEYSCFDIVEILFSRQVISVAAKHNLQYALSISCLTRLKVYMAKKGQDDFIGERDFEYKDFKTIKEILCLIGEESLIDYLSIARSLWTALQTNGKLRFQLYLRFSILFMLQFHDRLIKEWEVYSSGNIPEPPEEDRNMRMLAAFIYSSKRNHEKALELLDVLEEQTEQANPLMCMSIIMSKTDCVIASQDHIAASKYIQQAKVKIEKLNLTTERRNENLGYLCWKEGDKKFEEKQYTEALTPFNEALNYYKQCVGREKTMNMTRCHHHMAMALIMINKDTEAIKHYEAVLALTKNSSLSFPVAEVHTAYRMLQLCYKRLKQPDKASEYEKKSLELQKQYKQI